MADPPGPEGGTRARQVALQLLLAVERGRRLDLAWSEVAPDLPPRERGWVQELTFGTVRLQGRLDHLLNLHLRKGVASLPPSVLPILRMGAYQLLYMDGTPAYAAVSQAVEEVRRVAGRRLTGVVNGVLRSLGREGGGPERFPSLSSHPEDHLSTWGSHPRWLVRRWIKAHGVQGAARLVEMGNRVPPLYLRWLTGSLEDTLSLLKEAGLEGVEGPAGSQTVRLGPGTSPAKALNVVPGIIQDPAASWVVRWCGDLRGQRLVDLCSAPGGKAVALQADGAQVVAADRSLSRLQLLKQTRERLSLSLPLVQALGEEPPFSPVDAVLADVPCTGTGTLARHPDARWRLRHTDIQALSRVQKEILEGAARIVAPGGLLVYSTCTLEPEENEGQVEAFLQRHPEFIVEGGEGVPEVIQDGPYLRVLPHLMETDGAFAVRLRRERPPAGDMSSGVG